MPVAAMVWFRKCCVQKMARIRNLWRLGEFWIGSMLFSVQTTTHYGNNRPKSVPISLSLTAYRRIRSCSIIFYQEGQGRKERQNSAGISACGNPDQCDKERKELYILETVKNLVSINKKYFLIWIRYVEKCCHIWVILCCRISFLIIVLPVITLLYIFFDFFAH